jgi:hypothetical protein
MDRPAGRRPSIARQQADVQVRVDLLDAGHARDMRFDGACIGGAGHLAVEQHGPPLDQYVHARKVEAVFERAE